MMTMSKAEEIQIEETGSDRKDSIDSEKKLVICFFVWISTGRSEKVEQYSFEDAISLTRKLILLSGHCPTY